MLKREYAAQQLKKNAIDQELSNLQGLAASLEGQQIKLVDQDAQLTL